MPFPYYANLSSRNKKIYRTSDAIEHIPIKSTQAIAPLSEKLWRALENNARADVRKQASAICLMICRDLGIEAPVVKIKATRPSSDDEELHGLYESEGDMAVITAWMKTAAKGQVVAFRSFMRTILHELCHHIDYAYYELVESFHTEGFFKRESSLYKDIVPRELREKKSGPSSPSVAPKHNRKPSRKKAAKKRKRKPEQLEMF